MNWDYAIVAPHYHPGKYFSEAKQSDREEGLLLEILTDQAGIIGVLCHILKLVSNLRKLVLKVPVGSSSYWFDGINVGGTNQENLTRIGEKMIFS